MRVHALPRARVAGVVCACSCRYGLTFPRRPFAHRSCQTWGVPSPVDADRAEKLAHELTACRQRGIERIDQDKKPLKRVVLPELERLADRYAAARQEEQQGRIVKMKGLLRDALESFQRSDPDNSDKVRLIRALFFGSETGPIRKSAGELLDAARRDYSNLTQSRFDEMRSQALHDFSAFLIGFAEAASGAVSPRNVLSPERRGDAADAPSQAGTDRRRVPSKLEAVLRFSYTDPGDTDAVTIEEHQRIIEQHGRCWWGWYKAHHDEDHTAAMAERLRNHEIGLWERAEGLFYVAQCDDVVVGDGDPIESPDKNFTPAYYRHQPYPAWLSLRSIRKSNDEEFVQRFGELPSTQATVHWDPQPIPEPLVIQAEGHSILHLADLRFGQHHRWSTAVAPHRSFVTTEQAIARALLVHDIDLAAIGVVVICGNFVSGAPTAGAYGEALAFIDALCGQLPNVTREHVVIVPGADDFARPGDRERSEQSLYRKFHRDLYGTLEVDLIRLRRYERAGFHINVLPVNSVKMLGVDEQDHGRFGYGYDAQLNLMQYDYLRHHAHTRVINVVAAHHHLIPTLVQLPGDPQISIQERVMLGIDDAGSVLDKLSQNRVVLFLHGHLHRAGYRIITSDDGWQTAVCAAGTAGASENWLHQEYRHSHDNSLALYDIGEDRIRGRILTYDEAFGRDPSVRKFEIRY